MQRGGTGYALAMAALLAACGGDDGGGNGTPDAGGSDGGTGGPQPTWSWIQSEVLSGCDGPACHSAGNTGDRVVLEPGVAYGNVVDVPSDELPALDLIEPGVPEDSFLYRKLADTHRAACAEFGEPESVCGARMPLNASPLSSDALAAVESWILDGAPEN